jgi:exodeoxyribonuclease-3
MKITTWNVNGIRAAIQKKAFDWVQTYQPDVLCLQEIKAKPDQVDTELFTSMGYQYRIHSAERPGYSGVATLFKTAPKDVRLGMGSEEFDQEGRVIQFSHPDFELFNIYFPNGGRGLERVQYKLDFYAFLLERCRELMKAGRQIILTGDFNTAHKEIDLKNPKANEKNTGFLPEERVWIDKYLESGFIDIYRERYPEEEKYTWWTYRFNARQNNVGWRIDYFLVTEAVNRNAQDVLIHTEVEGSDHCPVTLIL